jgi:hypothetical protein
LQFKEEVGFVGIKLNVGASPIWKQDGWHMLDHKLTQNTEFGIVGDADKIELPDESCDVVFCSHVFEHIPHVKLPLVIAEINRVLKPGGVFRILTPDLARIARAYVEADEEFFRAAQSEDESLRTDLGLGGAFMNFIVSPGQDTALLNRDLTTFIAGYAHLYSYDYQMLSTILQNLGFDTRKAEFNDSVLAEMQTPLHVIGLRDVWQDLNQEFYSQNNLVHRLVGGQYEINFKVTGFDRDPLTSLIVEASKVASVSVEKANSLYNDSNLNYNKYAWSLLRDPAFKLRLESLNVEHLEIDN